MKKFIFILAVLVLTFSFPLNASYQNLFEQYGSQASNGAGALFYNPAMLGYKYAPNLDINVIKLGLEATNNALSINLWNSYIVKDTLQESDKATLLSNIPSSGFLVHPRANANLLGLKIGRFAFAPRVVSGVNLNISKDLIDLGLNGNQLGKIYNFSTNDLDAILYGEVSAGYGQAIKLNNKHNLYIGASFSYLYGVAYFDVTKDRSYFNSDSNFLQSTDTVSFRLCLDPKGNSGFGSNIGIAYDFSNSFTAGISLKNAYSFIKWNADSLDFSDNGGLIIGEGIVNLDSINLYKLLDMFLSGDSINGDSIFNKFIDTTFSTSYNPFTTHLPPILNIGAVWRGIYDPWKLSVNYEQGFSNTALSTVIPKLTVEGEYALGSFLPVRAGIGIGGKELLEYSLGLGFEFPYAYLDIGVSNHRGLFYGTKGISAELNFGFRSPTWSKVSGIVKDSITGKPLVARFTVTYGNGKTFTKTTDNNGKFAFRTYAPDIKIQIKKKDFETKTVSFKAEPKEVVYKTILMQPSTGLLICHVIDTLSSKPIADAPINIIPSKLYKIKSDSTGTAKINLLEGKYKIKIHLKDYLPFEQNVYIVKGKSITKTCALKINKGYLVGKAQNAKTKEGVICEITLLDSTMNKFEVIKTDSNGIYKVLLPSGKYVMNVKPLVKNYIRQKIVVEVKPAETIQKDILLLKKRMKFTFRNINFDFNRANIKPESYPVLDSLGMIMVQNPSIIVKISGHTDTRGSSAYNLKLSRLRAYAVKMYIVRHFNIPSSRIKAVGYGESRPLVSPERTKADYAKNRRVEFEVLREKK